MRRFSAKKKQLRRGRSLSSADFKDQNKQSEEKKKKTKTNQDKTDFKDNDFKANNDAAITSPVRN